MDQNLIEMSHWYRTKEDLQKAYDAAGERLITGTEQSRRSAEESRENYRRIAAVNHWKLI